MARSLTPGLAAEVTAAHLRPVIFYEGEFSTGTLRMWSGLGTISWNGQSWTGVGHLAAISAIEETTDISARGVTVSLSGIPASLISTVLGEARQGKPGRIWVGALTSAGTIVADPYKAFEGKLDVPVIDEAGETATISIAYESRLIDLERARERRYTDEDQKIDFADDEGFAFVTSLQDAVVLWGRG